MPTPTSTFRPTANVVATELDDSEAVLLDLETRRYFSLNDTGTRIWQLMNEDQDAAAIAAAISAEWDIEPAAAEQHVTAFFEELLEAGLIQPAPSTP